MPGQTAEIMAARLEADLRAPHNLWYDGKIGDMLGEHPWVERYPEIKARIFKSRLAQPGDAEGDFEAYTDDTGVAVQRGFPGFFPSASKQVDSAAQLSSGKKSSSNNDAGPSGSIGGASDSSNQAPTANHGCVPSSSRATEPDLRGIRTKQVLDWNVVPGWQQVKSEYVPTDDLEAVTGQDDGRLNQEVALMAWKRYQERKRQNRLLHLSLIHI